MFKDLDKWAAEMSLKDQKLKEEKMKRSNELIMMSYFLSLVGTIPILAIPHYWYLCPFYVANTLEDTKEMLFTV